MCEPTPLVRAFLLRPHKLPNGGRQLFDTGRDLQLLQNRFGGELDIFFLKDGGFAICLQQEYDSGDNLLHDTLDLEHELKILPRLIDLTQAV